VDQTLWWCVVTKSDCEDALVVKNEVYFLRAGGRCVTRGVVIDAGAGSAAKSVEPLSGGQGHLLSDLADYLTSNFFLLFRMSIVNPRNHQQTPTPHVTCSVEPLLIPIPTSASAFALQMSISRPIS